MSDTGKQSPLGVNVLGTLLTNQGFYINPTVRNYVGASKDNATYTPGKLIEDTCLKWVTYAYQNAYNNPNIDSTTYNNLLNIGQSRIPALANSPPPTYVINDPSGVWNGEATSSYPILGDVGQGQDAKWRPWSKANPNSSVTQWGWLRTIALQAWNEFNFNGQSVTATTATYKDFLASFLSFDNFLNTTNKAIYAAQNSKEFLKGTYSNMDDLISADISGVSLSSRAFGEDLVNLGKALDFKTLSSFGLPSNLLRTINENNAVTQNLNLAMLSAGLAQEEIDSILNDTTISVSLTQEQKLYGAYLIITGNDLLNILVPLNCRTKGLTTLADLLNIKKMFPISYTTLTVPIYNVSPGPTNSKTYYLLFVGQELNPQLYSAPVVAQIGPQIPPVTPPIVEIEPATAIIEQAIVETILAGGNVVATMDTYMPPPEPVYSPPPTVVAPLSTGGGGGCVALDSFVPLVETKTHNGKSITYAWQLDNNFDIVLGDKDLNVVTGKIKKALIDVQPCVRIQTSDGASLICSTTAKILTKEHGYIDATELFGKRVPVLRYNRTYNEGATIMHPTVFFDEVVTLQHVGQKYVRVIDTGDNAFWAGEKSGSYILHHNIRIDSELNFDKN